MNQEIQTLKKLYTNNKRRSFQVKDYSRLAGIPRVSFYYRYKGPKEFLTKILKEELERCLSVKNNTNCKRAFQTVLENIYQNWEFYTWMYKSMKKEYRVEVKTELIDEIKKHMNDFAGLKEGISQKKLQKIGEGIYSHLLSLIYHHCDQNIYDAYYGLEMYAPEIEGHRCGYFYKKS